MPGRSRSQVTCSCIEGARGPVGGPSTGSRDGRQVQTRIGPAWTGRGRPPAGYFTRRTAEDWLDAVLVAGARRHAAGRGADGRDVRRRGRGVPALPRVTTASASLRRCATTARCIRNHLLPAFGDWRLEDVSAEAVERWARDARRATARSRTGRRARSSPIFHGAHGARAHASGSCRSTRSRDVEQPAHGALAGEIDVFSPEEVLALVRAAEDEQDAAIFLTAAFTGLRQGELVALRWRDVDFAGSAHPRAAPATRTGALTTPKSGKVRSVPMAPAVAEALARLSASASTGPATTTSSSPADGGYLDALGAAPSATSARSQRAGLRPLRFHDLRHTFGTTMIAQGRHRPRPGVDGPRGHRDDAQVPALRPAPGRRAPRRRGVRDSNVR